MNGDFSSREARDYSDWAQSVNVSRTGNPIFSRNYVAGWQKKEAPGDRSTAFRVDFEVQLDVVVDDVFAKEGEEFT